MGPDIWECVSIVWICLFGGVWWCGQKIISAVESVFYCWIGIYKGIRRMSDEAEANQAELPQASGSTRTRGLLPPPSSMDWSIGSKSIIGKRQGNLLGPDPKRRQLDSVTSIDETVPTQDKEQLEADQRMLRYIPQTEDQNILTYDSLMFGKKLGVVQFANYIDNTYCQTEVLERLMEVKHEIRHVGTVAYHNLQKSLNEFGSPPTVFQFNSAYLYANIDALSGFALTNPCTRNGESIVGENELLFAVDINGGPGGFIEYMLTKKQWEAKVYGYAFKDEAYNYKIRATGHFPMESFEQWLGLDGKRGDGSIYNPYFVESFVRFIKKNTDFNNVHVVVADGRELSTEVEEDAKEIGCKPMILAEAMVALKVLRRGGTFVLRLYDIFTTYTAGLVYLMYRAFERVAIMRPETVTQGSAERFLVCKQYRGGKLCIEISNYLESLHRMDHGCHVNPKFPEDQRAEILELVPMDIIRSAVPFYNYLYESNTIIGEMQLEEAHNICRSLQFKHDGRIVTQRKTGIQSKCAELWNCPRSLRQQPRYASLSAELFINQILRPYPQNVLKRTEREDEVLLSYTVMENHFGNPHEWHFVSVGRDRGFYMGRGGNEVYRFTEGRWSLVDDEISLANQTLVYGDLVDEITQYDEKQITQTAFHIIDGMVLGGIDIRNLPYKQRMVSCSKFAKSMCKPSMNNLLLVRAKKAEGAKHLEASLTASRNAQVKGDKKKRPQRSPAYKDTGYLFIKTHKTGDIHADFLQTMQNRLYWKLDDDIDRNPVATDPKLTPVDAPALTSHIKMCSARQF